MLGSACGRYGFDAIGDGSTARDVAVPDVLITAGLVAWWKLDETGGMVASDSRGTAVGSLMGSPIWEPAGKINGALSFAPSGDRVAFGTPPSLADLPALTISEWIKPGAVTHDAGTHCVFDKGDSKLGGWSFETAYRANGDLGFAAYFGTANAMYRTSSGGLLALGRWSHIVATWDGSRLATGLRLYLDGAETSYAVAVDATGVRPGDSTIGAAINCINVTGFEGWIDDVKIFDRVL